MSQTKTSQKNRSITVDMLDIISNMDLTNEQKEDLVLGALKLTREQAHAVWEDDRIKAVRLNRSMEKIEVTIVIDPAGGIEVK